MTTEALKLMAAATKPTGFPCRFLQAEETISGKNHSQAVLLTGIAPECNFLFNFQLFSFSVAGKNLCQEEHCERKLSTLTKFEMDKCQHMSVFSGLRVLLYWHVTTYLHTKNIYKEKGEKPRQ